MKWEIEYTATAQKGLLSLDRGAAKRIKKYLDERIATAENPRRFGKGLSSNLAGLWRYRIGDYRIIVDIQDDKIVVLVLAVGHRNSIYGGH